MTPLVLIFYFWVLQLLQQTGTLAPALNARRPKIRSKSGPCWSVIGTRKISWWSWHGGVYEVMLMALMMESSGMYDNFWPWVGATIKMLFLVLCTWKSVLMITQKVRCCHCDLVTYNHGSRVVKDVKVGQSQGNNITDENGTVRIGVTVNVLASLGWKRSVLISFSVKLSNISSSNEGHGTTTHQ